MFLSAALSLVFVLAAFLPPGRSQEPVRLCKKRIPEISFKNLSPPYKDYDYFQHHRRVPFESGATAFSLVNAWWLAEASTLVYADEAYVRQRFSRAGLKHVTFLDRSGTQCFVAGNERFAIVAFRGSEIWRRQERFDPSQVIADFKTNIDIRLSDWGPGGKVHSGFKAALDAVWNDLLREIRKNQERGAKIWVTGHSLGAALATLAADRLQDAQGLYTYGSPRVGDQGFQERFRPRAFRVVNGSDIVASVPPENPYRHVGELKFIDPEGGIHDRPGPAEEESGGCVGPGNASESGKSGPEYNSGVFIPSSIRDHVPLLYSVLLWNELVESLTAERQK